MKKEAAVKKKAAHALSSQLMKMVQAPSLGSTVPCLFLDFSEQVSDVAGALADIEDAARRAEAKIQPELERLDLEIKNMEANLKTFGIIR